MMHNTLADEDEEPSYVLVLRLIPPSQLLHSLPPTMSQMSSILSNVIEDRFARFNHHRLRKPTTNVVEKVADRLQNMWADSTWSSYSSVMNQFDMYYRQLEATDFSIATMLFLEDAIHDNDHPITIASALQYSRIIGSVLHQRGINIDIRMYRRALKRQGALHAEHQAPPITRTELDQRLQTLPLHQRFPILLMWLTASRYSDLESVTRNNIEELESNDRFSVYRITFPQHKGDPFRAGTGTEIQTSGVDNATFHLWLQRYVAVIPPDLTYANLCRILDPYTEHSIKRGALLTMLAAGTSPHTLQWIAKHKSIDSLLHYIPRHCLHGQWGRWRHQ